MGIYIDGFKMPEGGYRTIEIAYDADRHPMALADGGDVFDVIPVPPHGRLGDLDAVEAEIREKTNEQFCINIVRAAPTIIPADPAEEVSGNSGELED